MEPYQERVVAEKAELDEKIIKLGTFLTSETANTLKQPERSLLIQQHQAMLAYSYILRDRIELF